MRDDLLEFLFKINEREVIIYSYKSSIIESHCRFERDSNEHQK